DDAASKEYVDSRAVTAFGYKASNQSIPSNTWRRLTSWVSDSRSQVLFDDNEMFSSASNGIITFKIDGLFDVTTSVRWYAVSTGQVRTSFHLNGSEYCSVGHGPSSTGFNIDMTRKIFVEAGDELEVWVQQRASGSVNVYGDPSNGLKTLLQI